MGRNRDQSAVRGDRGSAGDRGAGAGGEGAAARARVGIHVGRGRRRGGGALAREGAGRTRGLSAAAPHPTPGNAWGRQLAGPFAFARSAKTTSSSRPSWTSWPPSSRSSSRPSSSSSPYEPPEWDNPPARLPVGSDAEGPEPL